MYNEVRRQRSLHNGDVNAALRFLEVASRRDEKIYWRAPKAIITDGKIYAMASWPVSLTFSLLFLRPKEEEKSHVSGYVSYTNVGTNVEGRKAPTLTMPSSNMHNLSHKAPNEVILVALESRIPELSKHIWHYMVDTKFEGENLPRKCNDEHGISLYLGQLTSSPSKTYNSSCRAPNDALSKALESGHPGLSNHI
ncbi:hypothetical protein AHAS_Ahas19G0219000 [Arachis hypogaea]